MTAAAWLLAAIAAYLAAGIVTAALLWRATGGYRVFLDWDGDGDVTRSERAACAVIFTLAWPPLAVCLVRILLEPRL